MCRRNRLIGSQSPEGHERRRRQQQAHPHLSINSCSESICLKLQKRAEIAHVAKPSEAMANVNGGSVKEISEINVAAAKIVICENE